MRIIKALNIREEIEKSVDDKLWDVLITEIFDDVHAKVFYKGEKELWDRVCENIEASLIKDNLKTEFNK